MTQQRARSNSEEWDRARRAYQALIAGHDPVATVAGVVEAVDLRPAGLPTGDYDTMILVSGPNDLVELKQVVERSIGIGTWPTVPVVTGSELVSGVIPIDRPAAMLSLLLAMEGLIEDRSPWRKWRTCVDTLAAAVADIEFLTLETQVCR